MRHRAISSVTSTPSYGMAVTRRLRVMGIRDRPITPCSPWQNGHVERLIGSILSECLDHVVVLGERHLRNLLANYLTYYNGVRRHATGPWSILSTKVWTKACSAGPSFISIPFPPLCPHPLFDRDQTLWQPIMRRAECPGGVAMESFP
jgi:transposase InsO family protein